MGKIAFLSGASNQTTLDGISRAFSREFTSPGVIGDSDLTVTQNGTPNNTVLVGTGAILIGFQSPLSGQEDKYYFGFLDSAENVTISANSSGNARVDAIIAKVNTSGGAATDNNGALVLQAIAGTPGASPVAPTDSDIATALGAGVPYIVLAHVAVANGFSSITNGNITDMRVFADTNERVVDDISSDFVASGFVWSQTSGLVGQMTGGRAYIGGRLITKPIVTKTFTASKDTYVDLPDTARPSNYNDLTFTEVANGASAPALAAGSIRLAKVVTNGSAITSVTTSGWDGNGVSIRNLEQRPRTIGYAAVTSNQGTFTADTQLTGLSVTVDVPAGARIRISGIVKLGSSVTGDAGRLDIQEGGSTLQLAKHILSTTDETTFNIAWVGTPSTGAHTYYLSARRNAGTGNITSYASSIAPAYIHVEIV